MGMSSVSYQGRQFAAPDGLLEIWLKAVADEVSRIVDRPDWLEQFGQDWHDQATEGFDFGIVPNLDKWSSDCQREMYLGSLFQQTLIRLKQSGDVASGTRRDALGLGGGAPRVGRTGSYDDSEVPELGQRFIDILKGE